MKPCCKHGCYWGRACVVLALVIVVVGFVALNYVSAWMQ
jgi:hypothetical protein